MLNENSIAKLIVDAAFHIHVKVGPGLLESAYHSVLMYELQQRGLAVESEVPIPMCYGDVMIPVAYRADLIVDNKVIVEIKSIDLVLPVHKKQLLTYLRLTNLHLGLLINFGAEKIKDGISRVVDHLPEENFIH